MVHIRILLPRHCFNPIFVLDNTGWKAAHEVYGAGLQHLLCRWHGDKYDANVTMNLLFLSIN